MPGQFNCRYSSCHRSYNRKEHLVRHEKSHGQIRPYLCRSCGADFYRSDILKRHIRLSSKCKPTGTLNEEQSFFSETSNLEPDYLQPSGALDTVTTIVSGLRNSIYEGLGPSFTAIAGREELERLFFTHFHPHWPLLDEDSFMNVAQIPELVTAVLIAGLWMLPNRVARLEAQTQHDSWMQKVTRRLLSEQPPNTAWTTPSAECLPYFQALLIPLIIFTYRGLDHFPNTIMSYRHFFDILQSVGAYQQKRIDESSPNPVIRQQYQRLALLHFKAFMNYNSLFRTRFPRLKSFEWFKPSILQVRVPLVTMKDAIVDHRRSELESTLVGNIMDRGYIDKLSQATVAALVVWDFSLGMILACILTYKKDEDPDSLLRRIEPNLFLHLRDWEADPEDSPATGIDQTAVS